jgi:hypothetical protein
MLQPRLRERAQMARHQRRGPLLSLLLLTAVAVACSHDDGATTSSPEARDQACARRGVQDCARDSACAVVVGSELDVTRSCFPAARPAGCRARDTGGGAAITFRYSDTGSCWRFASGVAPLGWSSASATDLACGSGIFDCGP